MSAFDLREKNNNVMYGFSQTDTSNLKIRTSSDTVVTEPIIAFKIYDAVRIQDCITPKQLGPIIVAEPCCVGSCNYNVGDQVLVPMGAASIIVKHLNVLKVIIVSKKENPFKKGYWDITLKYVFEYKIVFVEADGTIMGSVIANSMYTKKVTLFGSEGIDLSVSTDLLSPNSFNFGSKPFVLIESKAVILAADIKFCRNSCNQFELSNSACIDITIGLFSIVKLFRIVDLAVESKGFYIPREDENNDLHPCDFFEGLSFPMDIFAPQQKKDFMNCNSGDIPAEHKPARDVCEDEYIVVKKPKNKGDNCGCTC